MAILHSSPGCVLLVLGVLTLACLNCWLEVNGEDDRRCQDITIPMCKGIGYNLTYMPNQFNHETQEEAGLEVHQFWPLVEIQCSPDLKLFLCSMYTPICMPTYKKPLPACRSVCERAKEGCAPLMAQYGFQWPERMKCENLPEYGTEVCMDPNNTEKSTPSSTKGDGHTHKPNGHNKPDTKPKNPVKSKNPLQPHIPDITGYTVRPNGGIFDFHDVASKACQCSCKMVTLPKTSAYYNKITTGGISNCALNCTSPYFNDDEMTFATFWVGLWSILCCIATAMTVLTFFVDMQRFKYPERPIVFLSGCYFMVSIGYIIRLIVGHQAVACDGNSIRYETTGPALCTVVFLLIYFFGMASSIWWVILSFTWFLSAGLKWGQEAIASYSQYFHLAAWLVPSVKSIAVLAMSSVDGDAISGICYVGNQNLNNLRASSLRHCLFIYSSALPSWLQDLSPFSGSETLSNNRVVERLINLKN
ncbi:hypothetical protein FSP39_002202 [Pinctada imbricata]|uniref:Uncharacterized protein n=1 Tax=Pinctada imbricata TaxID=66713 RepID=A0AA88XJX5_PINIB|nr:hypothetical protein FSP39_002202 [Pinctada imbricata]